MRRKRFGLGVDFRVIWTGLADRLAYYARRSEFSVAADPSRAHGRPPGLRRVGWLAIVSCLSLMMFTPSPASARGAAQKDAYSRCLETGDAAQGVYPAMMDCIHAEIGRRDAVLNATYQALRRRLPPERMRALQIEERAWIKSRDDGCRKKSAQEDANGDTPDDHDSSQDRMMFWSFCVLDETNDRIFELRKIR